MKGNIRKGYDPSVPVKKIGASFGINSVVHPQVKTAEGAIRAEGLRAMIGPYNCISTVRISGIAGPWSVTDNPSKAAP